MAMHAIGSSSTTRKWRRVFFPLCAFRFDDSMIEAWVTPFSSGLDRIGDGRGRRPRKTEADAIDARSAAWRRWFTAIVGGRVSLSVGRDCEGRPASHGTANAMLAIDRHRTAHKSALAAFSRAFCAGLAPV